MGNCKSFLAKEIDKTLSYMQTLKLFILLILLLTINDSYSQIKFDEISPVEFDTNKAILNSKMLILNFNYWGMEKEDIYEAIDKPVEYKILASNNFGPFIFIELQGCDFSKLSSNQYFKTTFVTACNTKTNSIYRIKGYKINNDIIRLMYDLRMYIIDSYEYRESFLRNRKKFLKTFYIENIDMKCFYKIFRKKSKLIKKYYKLDCAKPNPSFLDIYIKESLP